MTSGNRRSTKRSINGDEQSAISGHFVQRGSDCFLGQQSMSAGIATLRPGARKDAANDAGPAIKPASMQIATRKRMNALGDTLYSRTVCRFGQLHEGRPELPRSRSKPKR